MNANINSVVVTLSEGTSKKINVDENGMILVIGSGPYAGAFRVQLEDATQAELAAAEGEIIEEEPVPFDEKLAAANEKIKQSQYNKEFEKAVKFLSDLSADEYIEIVLFAKNHNNTFPKFCKDLKNIANADDAYCSTLIALSRPYGTVVEEKAFVLLDGCANHREFPAAFEEFNKLWESLKTLRDLVG